MTVNANFGPLRSHITGTVSEINVATESYHRFILLCHALIYQVFLVGGLASTHTDSIHEHAPW